MKPRLLDMGELLGMGAVATRARDVTPREASKLLSKIGVVETPEPARK